MQIDDRRLDGNAAAGVLEEIFPFEMTMAQIHCAGCGAVEPVGAEVVYLDAPGMVMRCAHCESVLMTMVHGGGRYWIEMRVVSCLQIEA
jgi:ribosomal protein S27E